MCVYIDACDIEYSLTTGSTSGSRCDNGNGRKLICKVSGSQTHNVTVKILHRSSSDLQLKSNLVMNNKTIRVRANTCWKSDGYYACLVEHGSSQKEISFSSNCSHEEESCTLSGVINLPSVCNKSKVY